MYLGDNFIVGGIAALIDEFIASRPDAQMMLTRASMIRANSASWNSMKRAM
jgi:glucose-1-phosphate thymidylyltransferase